MLPPFTHMGKSTLYPCVSNLDQSYTRCLSAFVTKRTLLTHVCQSLLSQVKKFHSTSHSITPPVYPCVSNSNKSCSRYKPKCSWWFRSIFLSSDGKKSCFKIQIYWWALPRIQCKTCQKTYIGNDYTEKNGSKMTLTNGLSANGTTP